VHCFQQSGAVGAIHNTHIKIGAEGLNGGGRKFFGDQDDGLSHEYLFLR
jgi:hypothetical protein